MRASIGLLFVVGITVPKLWAQHAFTWPELRDKLLSANPNLLAGQLNIDEFRANEVTAYLRPNPDFTLSTDGTQIAPNSGIWRPFAGTQFSTGVSYLHEREHKRELRRQSAEGATTIAQSDQSDLQRNLIFNLRNAFVQTLQAKAWLQLAEQNLAYWNNEVSIGQTRLQAGDISQEDLDRLELQLVQYQTDVNTAQVNLRTAKIQLLQLLNDRTPLDQFDVTGTFDFSSEVKPLEQFRTIALDTRPDLKAAVEAVAKAKTDNQLAVANGSTDPTFSAWWSHNPSFNNPFAYETLGASVSIPIRIFDKNQGEKVRTQLDITRSQRLRDAAEAQVLGDVDSAYATLMSTLSLLRPYKDSYLPRAAKVRDTVSFAYQNGGASLLDFLDAQQAYRSVEVSYVNLIGSYLSAANQLNLAVGREVIP
jgi:cobalt-zinc-cadmium efflux system outer membrane protein